MLLSHFLKRIVRIGTLEVIDADSLRAWRRRFEANPYTPQRAA